MNSKQHFFSVRKLSFLAFIFFLITNLNSYAQCASNATSTADEDIFNVTFGTLNNNSTCSTTGDPGTSIQSEYSNYAFAGFSGSVPSIDRGCSIPFSVQVGTCGGNWSNAVAIYIDWNNDADFIDAGENVYLSTATTNGPHTEAGNITVPVTATLGNCKMRVICNETAPGNISPCGTYSWGETEDYFVNITNGGGIAPYVSSSVTQLVSGSVSQCAFLQQIICIPVVMGAGCTAGSLTQFQLGAGSSTNLPADVSKIHIFYTGTSNVYTAANEFVTGGTTPSGATNTINGSQTLLPNATNYFWVTYDMNNASTIGDLIDASCTQITIGGSNQVPTSPDPVGNGTITTCPCSFNLGSDVTLCAPFTYTLNGPAGFDTYTWTPGGATTQNLVVNSAGTYTCTGTLINGGLVSNGDFSSGNTGFTTSYALGTGGTWGPLSNPGTYSVTNNPNAAHTNFYSFGDHTTGTGNMLTCNGSDIANTVVWSQTITVTPNTNYNFSAWVASVENTTNEAQLQFSINGNLIGPVVSAPLTGAVWLNFYVNWNSGSNTSAVIKIVDQSTEPAGNDFVIDDITFERVCTFSDVITIGTGTSTLAVNSPTTCPGVATTLTANGANTYTWSTGATTQTISVSPNTTSVYTFTGTTASGCTGSATATVTVGSVLNVTVNNPTICSGTSTVLTAGSATNYTWSTGATTSTISVSPTVTTTYTVIGESNSCVGTNTSVVTVNAAPSVSVTNETICAGTSTALTASGASSYTWSANAGGVTTSTALVSPTITTVYNVTGETSGCIGINSSTVTVVAIPQVAATSATVCSGNIASLTASGANTYTWLPSNTTGTTLTLSPVANETVMVIGAVGNCTNTNFASVTVNQYPNDDYTFYLSQEECSANIEFVLVSGGNASNSYNLNFGDNTNTNFTDTVNHQYLVSGNFQTTLTITQNGCATTVTKPVVISSVQSSVIIPNTFSPNGDNINDTYSVNGICITDYELTIFNRWGNQVFATTDLTKGWDGNQVPDGVYFYIVKYKLNGNNDIETKNGSITLFR